MWGRAQPDPAGTLMLRYWVCKLMHKCFEKLLITFSYKIVHVPSNMDSLKIDILMHQKIVFQKSISEIFLAPNKCRQMDSEGRHGHLISFCKSLRLFMYS